MDTNTIISVVAPIATLVGGWSIGRRGLSRQTIDLLAIQVNTLKESNESKTAQITELTGKVNVLESMITQRAEVAEVREIVERIAVKVGA
ncbi:MAG TPA: hypothetical protein VIY48_02875 [Candidatus Paceibacterota bacterium]